MKQVSERSGIAPGRIGLIEIDDRYAKPLTLREKLGLCKTYGITMDFFKNRG